MNMNMLRIILVSLIMGAGLCYAQESSNNAAPVATNQSPIAAADNDADSFEISDEVLDAYLAENPIVYHDPNICELYTQYLLAWIATLPGVIPLAVKIKEYQERFAAWWAAKEQNSDATQQA